MWAWLNFVHYDKDICPHPGPCRNDDLLKYNTRKKVWEPKSGLIQTQKLFGGNYTRVPPQTWFMFKEVYIDAGPTIMCTTIKVSINCKYFHMFSFMFDSYAP